MTFAVPPSNGKPRMTSICTRDTGGLVFGDLLFGPPEPATGWTRVNSVAAFHPEIPDILPLPSYPS